MKLQNHNTLVKKSKSLEKKLGLVINLHIETIDTEDDIYYIYSINTNNIYLFQESNTTSKSDFQIFMDLLGKLELLIDIDSN